MRSLLLLAAVALALGLTAATASAQNRYELVHGCYDLQSGGQKAGGPYRLQATELGRYLLYTKDRKFLSASGEADEPSEDADWWVEPHGGGFKLRLEDGRHLRSDLKTGADPAEFSFTRADGCPEYPEVETNVDGDPSTGLTPYDHVEGFAETHMHMMAFEFLGGSAHCGRPWHRYGAPYALVDCPDHQGQGAGAVMEQALYGEPHTHDPVGWPTFKDWPHHDSLTHEQSYWKWVERAWRGGLRLYVNLFVENHVLCEIYPLKRNPCNEMDSVRLQHKDILALENYIDAQYGGPGKGWFRIVRSPYEARRVINDGKMAVVLGIEISDLFNCGHYNYEPDPGCDREGIERQLQEVAGWGVKQMELVNKFDNALSGVAGDGGAIGPVVNNANKYTTNTYWDMRTCTTPPGAEDKEQPTSGEPQRDALFGRGFAAFLPPGQAPVYPDPPHCNSYGLTDLGQFVVNRMIDMKMILDPDHQSVAGRNASLALAEARDYSGVVMSHSWSTPDSFPRVYRLGGFIGPGSSDAAGYVETWREHRAISDPRYLFGIGYGADQNGFAHQPGPPRAEDPKIAYPFKSHDGKQTLHKERSGERVWDYNADGIAHYGMHPDWIEHLRLIAGDQIVKDMAQGAEAYLQTWERADGVPGPGCRSARGRFTRRGLFRVHLGATAEEVLKRAGQPATRTGRAWEWCVHGDRNKGRHVAAAFDRRGRLALVASDALGHRAHRVERGGRPPGRARAFGQGVRLLRVGRANYVFGVKNGRVAFLAAASRAAAKSPQQLRAYLRLAGLL